MSEPRPGIDRDDLVEFTRALVRIPSVYDPDRGLDESQAAELVAAQMTSTWMFGMSYSRASPPLTKVKSASRKRSRGRLFSSRYRKNI